MSYPQYYAVLSISRTATPEEIKQAYRKISLTTHPDRLPSTATEAERRRATARFQEVADAYYVLSDPGRRKEYDSRLPSFSSSNPASSGPTYTSSDAETGEDIPSSSSGGFGSFFSSFFPGDSDHAPAEETFTSAFSDLLEPELGRSNSYIWGIVGGVSGAGLGFIAANIPGAMAGAFAGNRLGKIRDAKGKSVAEVFTSLPGNRKAEILRMLMTKVFSTLGSTGAGAI